MPYSLFIFYKLLVINPELLKGKTFMFLSEHTFLSPNYIYFGAFYMNAHYADPKCALPVFFNTQYPLSLCLQMAWILAFFKTSHTSMFNGLKCDVYRYIVYIRKLCVGKNLKKNFKKGGSICLWIIF